MTRSVVIGILIIIVLALSLHFYTQWDLNRFEALLPKPPVTNDTTQGTAEAKSVIENPEKIDTVTHEAHRHGDARHTSKNVSKLAIDKTQAHPVLEERSQSGVPNLEVPEPIEDPVSIQLHAKKLELEKLQKEVNDRGDRFYNDLEAQSISVDEANRIFEEINDTLKYLREHRRQWLREYAEHYGTEYQGPEYWVNPQMIDEAVLKEQVYQEAQEQGISRGYIVLPRINP